MFLEFRSLFKATIACGTSTKLSILSPDGNQNFLLGENSNNSYGEPK